MFPLLASFRISTAVKEEQEWSLCSKENKEDKIENRVHHVLRHKFCQHASKLESTAKTHQKGNSYESRSNNKLPFEKL